MMMMRQALARAGRTGTMQIQKRKMGGGGFDHKFFVKKNKFVEEWNGRREITEKAFDMTSDKVPTVLLTLIVFPFAIYSATRTELINSGDRRYKDVC
mmetsp:Transcript_22771/g.33444  ORF Transcript_22771/g.33444 Transcript_22771/m.33444 type:complete len:97 (+) Transcript_22771:129-419(+)